GSIATAGRLLPAYWRPQIVVGLARRSVVAASEGMEAAVGVSSPVLGVSARRAIESQSAVPVVFVAEPAETFRCAAVAVPRKRSPSGVGMEPIMPESPIGHRVAVRRVVRLVEKHGLG